MDNKDCVFCKIIRGEIPSTKTYEDDKFIAILDINPKTPGHTLVIAKDHFKTLLDTPTSLGCELMDAVKNVSLDLVKQGKAEGFNFIFNNGEVAGQIVPHVHMHILPRKSGDGLKMLV
ncbi:HIT domain protein [uncultured archaeon]|nr:HIT domain protein [uncultured archaeon]